MMHIALGNRLMCLAAGAPAPAPALALGFLASSLDSRVTFSRASAANDVIAGVMTSFGTDAPRISAANGLLVEETRTNSLGNGDCTGATVGVVGSGGALPTGWNLTNAAGLTTEVMGSGTDSGFPYVELKISGTASGTTYDIQLWGAIGSAAASASAGQVWTGSLYAKRTGGSEANINQLQVRLVDIPTFANSAGGLSGVSTTSYTRIPFMRTTGASTTGIHARFKLDLVTSGAVNITLRLSANQLELGYGATSYINTTSGAATRAADSVTLTDPSVIPAAAGTVLVHGTSATFHDTAASTAPRFLSMAFSSVQLRVTKAPATSVVGWVTTNLTNQANDAVSVAALGTGTTFKAALRWTLNDYAVSLSGETPVADTTADVPGAACSAVALGFGSAPSTAYCNGYLRQVNFYNEAKDNTSLQALSA